MRQKETVTSSNKDFETYTPWWENLKLKNLVERVQSHLNRHKFVNERLLEDPIFLERIRSQVEDENVYSPPLVDMGKVLEMAAEDDPVRRAEREAFVDEAFGDTPSKTFTP